MRPRRHDPVMTAIMQQIETLDRTLGRLRVPASVYDDLRQLVLITTWREAWRGRVAWLDPPSLRGFLRVAARRAAYEWRAQQRPHEELREHPANAVDAESLVIAKNMLRLLRESTTPERWRAITANAKGIAAPDIAKRERVPLDTIYTRIRLGRADIAAALQREDAAIYVRRKK